GNIHLTGQSYASNQNDYYTIKMTPDGDVLWTARYNGPGAFLFAHDVAYDIGLDSTGDVYVTGSSNAPGSATGDYVTIRYDGATGAQVWLDRYSGGSNEVAYELAIDAADHLYVTGGSFQNGHKFVTIRYDVATGTRDWVAIDAPAFRNIATQIALDAQGDVIVSGLADPDGDESNFNENIATIKHRASDGAVLWSQSYGSNAVGTFDVPHDLVIDSADHVFVTGENTGVIILLEYEGATGALLQLDTVPGGPNEIAAGLAMTLDPDERPVIAALARNYNTENRDYLTLAYPAQTVASRIGDLDGDDVVGPADLAMLLASWGRCEACPEDLDGDGDVDAADLAMLLADWG
ncbi:MAG: SBBP repeat-containing protein, partial [Phycisphaerales bacterium]|nr:SBBP repeat-containing protein [Phycisphaerales bacterium]